LSEQLKLTVKDVKYGKDHLLVHSENEKGKTRLYVYGKRIAD
jgi:hypothetical protein